MSSNRQQMSARPGAGAPGRLLAAWALAGLLALACAAPAGAQAVLQGLSVAGQGGHDVVRLDFSEPIAEDPAGFVLHAPARIALDFAGVADGTGRAGAGQGGVPAGELAHGNVSGVQVAEAGGRTRVVLGLKRASAYRLLREGASLLVVLGGPDGAQGDDVAPAARAWRDGQAGGRGPLLRHIDFRRGEGGAGRVMVELSSDQASVDVRRQGQSLVAEFAGAALAEGLSRRMDVTDFGTPVRAIASSQAPGRVRMVIDADGDWEHAAYQSGRELVIEVKPRQADPARLTQGPGFTGERLTLDFQDVDVRTLLHVIADFTGLNIIASDSVSGALTLRLKDVPWDQALDIILEARNLGMRKNGSVLWVAPKDELMAKERAELEAQAAMRELEPLVTRAFQLNYTKAGDIAGQLTSQGGSGGAGGGSTGTRLLSPRGSVVAEPRTNQIFVSDIPGKIADVQELLARLDIPVRQVLIEARIVEASDTFGRSLGVRLGATDLRTARGGDSGYPVGGGNRVAWGTNYGNVVATTGQGGTIDTSASFVNLPATSSTGANVATFAFSIFSSAANRFLNLELSALEADGKGKVVSSPRVVTADQSKALIEQGTEIPYQEATSSGATSVSFRKANLKLEVTPQITPEGNIIMELSVNKDSVGQQTDNGFAINTKHVQTQVLVENGGTVVIGGIYEMSESDDTTKVPLLGDIPVMGHLFKSRTRSSSKQEMLVFITPKVVTDQRAALR